MTAYQRKTRDIWNIEQYTGPQYGWEVVCAEDSFAEARKRRKEYRENQPEYPVRIRLRREKLAELRGNDFDYPRIEEGA